jgi:hypothetical protein
MLFLGARTRKAYRITEFSLATTKSQQEKQESREEERDVNIPLIQFLGGWKW